MPRYLVQATPTDSQWSAVIQNPQNRKAAIRPLLESLGGRLDEYYFAIGDGTVLAIVELPDQEALDALMMAVRATGAMAPVKAMAIQTAEEAVETMKKAGEITYSPPSG